MKLLSGLLVLGVLSVGATAFAQSSISKLVAPDDAGVVFDSPSADRCWARGADYKACFTPEGARFVPFLGADAPRTTPVAFELTGARVGGLSLELAADVEPRREGRRVSFDHGALRECYELGGQGMEQSFELDALPARGELRLIIAIDTELEPRREAGGIVFSGPRGGVRYGATTVFDARGRSAPGRVELCDGGFEIVVDASFVAGAALPILVDPVISTFSLDVTPAEDIYPDVAYDGSLDLYVVVWQRRFAANDHDVQGCLVDGAGNVVREFAIDLSGTDVLRPKVAGIDALDRFLVVTIEDHTYAYGRTIDLASTFSIGPAVVVHDFDCHDHDLGGDAGTTPPYYYCLVAEVDVSGCYYFDWRLIEANGNPGPYGYRGGCDLACYEPRVSKTGYDGPSGSRRWGVTWEDSYSHGLHSAELDSGTTSLHNSMKVASGSPYEIESHGVSSKLLAADGSGTYLVAWRKNGHCNGTVVRDGSIVVPSVNLLYDLGTTNAAVDSDGSSFVAALDWTGSGFGRNLFVATYDLIGTTLHRTELVELAPPDSATRHPAITSTRSGGGSPQRFFVAWDEVTDTSSDVMGALYDSVGPGTRDCTGAANSVGGGAEIGAFGEKSLATNDFHLTAIRVPPDQFGLFFLGLNGIEIPYGEGFLCIGGAISRILPPVISDSTGFATTHVDFSLPLGGLVTAGSPGVRYQYWYRDPTGGPAGFNFSDALHVEHLP